MRVYRVALLKLRKDATEYNKSKIIWFIKSILGFNKLNIKTGICNNLKENYNVEVSAFEYALYVYPSSWKKYSGDTVYPVPHSESKEDFSAKYAYIFRKNMWNEKSEYGKLRLEFLDWIIENAR